MDGPNGLARPKQAAPGTSIKALDPHQRKSSTMSQPTISLPVNHPVATLDPPAALVDRPTATANCPGAAIELPTAAGQNLTAAENPFANVDNTPTAPDVPKLKKRRKNLARGPKPRKPDPGYTAGYAAGVTCARRAAATGRATLRWSDIYKGRHDPARLIETTAGPSSATDDHEGRVTDEEKEELLGWSLYCLEWAKHEWNRECL
ncbi:hypothetical protein FS749_008058 [Ceratobasidium sp. UAMH 11750]|nr:hypothetical protein FS749_008058 [Ceratobasidium sp. UAMH 11750]